jgi:hypothetical protein
MEGDPGFRGPAAINDEWIDGPGTIIDELFLGEDAIAGLTDGVDELSA